MREFLDMPFKQIADVVGVPENTVKSRMRYALEKLRLELDEVQGSGEGRAVTGIGKDGGVSAAAASAGADAPGVVPGSTRAVAEGDDRLGEAR